MASKTEQLVAEERDQIKAVRAAFSELLESLKPHRENMRAVRAWRLNIRSNVERLSEPHRARLDDDTVTTLKDLQTRLNECLDALDMTLRSEADAETWLDDYSQYVQARREVRQNDAASKQQRWQSDISEIYSAVAQAHRQVGQYRQQIEQAKRQQRLAEDRYTGLLGIQRDFNGKVDALSGTLSTRQDVRRWQQALEVYQTAAQRAQQAADAQPVWSTELAAIRSQVQAAAAAVEQFTERLRQSAEIRVAPDEDRRQELEQALSSELQSHDHDMYLQVAHDPQQMLVFPVPLDVSGLSEGGISDGIDVFNDLVDQYEDGDIEDGELDSEIKTMQGQIADFIGSAVAQAIINAGYFPGNPAGQQLQRLEYTDGTVMRAATRYAQSLAEQYEPQSYAVQQRTQADLEPLQVAVSGRLSAPKQPSGQLDVELLKLAISPRLSRPVLHYEEGRALPQAVADELLSYTSGPFKLTEQHADEINSYHTQYGTLPLELAQHVEASDDLIEQAQGAVRELESTFSGFTGKHNSATGTAAVAALTAAVDTLGSATDKQARAVSRAVDEFNAAAAQLENWIDSSWYQFGGTPENHKSAYAGDKSTYSSGTKSSFSKEDL